MRQTGNKPAIYPVKTFTNLKKDCYICAMDKHKYCNDKQFGKDAKNMDGNAWHKRGKRWQAAQLSGIQQLYGEKPANLPIVERSPLTKGKSASAKLVAKRRKMEAAMQIALINWCCENDLFIISIPNEGKRSIYTASLLKAMGLYAGASDLFLLERSKGDQYRGFFIELKAPGKKPTKNQLTFMQRAMNNGFKAAWFDDVEEIKRAIKDYLYKEVTI